MCMQMWMQMLLQMLIRAVALPMPRARHCVRFAVANGSQRAVAMLAVLLSGAALHAQQVTQPPARQSAQQPSLQAVSVSRAEAFNLAVMHSPFSGLLRADSAAAAAEIALARQFENPSLSASYSKSDPQAHFALDIPFALPGQRRARIAAGVSGLRAMSMRSAFTRALLMLSVDTAYTRAQGSIARASVTARMAADADSLLATVRARRDAGDASDLDVEIARVFAGQNVLDAINDSIAAVTATTTLQQVMGLRPDSVQVILRDVMIIGASGEASFGEGPFDETSFADNTAPAVASATVAATAMATSIPAGTATGSASSAQGSRTPSLVSAALLDAEAARYRVLAERRRRFGSPAVSVGFETVDPTGHPFLPTVGLSVPLPLFNRNSAAIQIAMADASRAQANLAIARLEQATVLANARRDVAAARTRLTASRQLLASADRISALSVVAYREGATPLATVLDAQRSARELLRQYVDDAATARVAENVLRFHSNSTTVTNP